MKLMWAPLLVILCSVAICSYATDEGKEMNPKPGYRQSIPFENLSAQFKQPDMIYAPYEFWFYDAPLDPELARKMAGVISGKRFNPGYAHARSSGAEAYCKPLDHPIPGKTLSLLPHDQWLSPLWFETLGAALDESGKNGAKMGFCDDYWWPMGRADGKVLAKFPELKAVSLGWDTMEVPAAQTIHVPESFFVVAARLATGEPAAENAQVRIESKTLDVIGSGQPFDWTAPDGAWRLYVFYKIHQPGLDRGDVNYLDRRLAQAYIDIAYEPYKPHFKDQFGKSMSGVFCDHEGSLGFKLAWSEDFEAVYQKKTGMELKAWLPLLFEEDVEGQYVKARWNWYDAASDLYAECFFTPLNRWCEEQGMYFTGHTWESPLSLQAAADGDFFKIQRTFSIPGQDCLGSGGLNVRDFKETQSVCEFDGKRFMSEIMGLAGWHQSPALMKQIVNAITAWGVSHVIPHGVFLDRELNSIPFPCDWYDENPFWDHMDIWTDYVRRASFMNSCGQLVPDVLLVNPMDSIWVNTCPATFDPKMTNLDVPVLFMDVDNWTTDEVKQIDKVYADAISTLTQSRTEYLIADRYYIEQMQASGSGALTRDEFSFKVVVLPRLTVLPLKVAEKLLAFAESGGLLAYLHELPKGSTDNGMNDPAMNQIIDKLKQMPNVKHSTLEELPQLISLTAPPQVAFVKGEFPILQSHRRIDGRDFIWLANNSEEAKSCRLRIRDLHGQCAIWDCENGEVRPVPSENAPDGGVFVDLTFEPCEAFWLAIDAAKEPIAANPTASSAPNEHITALDGPWRVHIDRACQNPLIPESLPFYCVDWTASWLDVSQDRYVRYSFTLPDNPVAGSLMITADDNFLLWVNGNPVKSRFTDDIWSQVSIYDINQYLHAGKNVIAVDGQKSRGLIFQGSAQFTDKRTVAFQSGATAQCARDESADWFMPRFDSSQWKPVVVLGVPPVEPWIDVPAPFLASGGVEKALAPWSEWGLGGFSGFVDYEKEFTLDEATGNEMLDLGKVKYMAEVWVNGEPAGRRFWPPHKFSIGHALKKGPNTVRIRVGNLLANVMNEFDKRGKFRMTFGMERPTPEQLESGLFGPVRIVEKPNA